VPIPEAGQTLCEYLDAVVMACCDSRTRKTDRNHISLNVIRTVRIDVEDVQEICRDCSYDLPHVAGCCVCVHVVEIYVSMFSSEGSNSAACLSPRLPFSNPNGHFVFAEIHYESTDSSFGNFHIDSLSHADLGLLDGTLISELYQIIDRIQRKRVVAKTIETA
jgi:hypothetical protein